MSALRTVTRLPISSTIFCATFKAKAGIAAHAEGPERAAHGDALAHLGLIAAAAVQAFGPYGAAWLARGRARRGQQRRGDAATFPAIDGGGPDRGSRAAAPALGAGNRSPDAELIELGRCYADLV